MNPILIHHRAPTAGFEDFVLDAGSDLHAVALETVQVNIGAECNLACRHCHVGSSPKRRERMDWPTMQAVLRAAMRIGARSLDITGGAPELHPEFRTFVAAARGQGLRVMVRTNLTVLLRPELSDLPEFCRANQVQLAASLPCYLLENVDRQRGEGVFDESLEVLRRLNELGYGCDPELELDLIYNPGGTALPPAQAGLEQAYRKELRERYGIEFTRLYALANMAIGRFASDLEHQGRLARYREKLRASFNPETLPGLMCRSQIHVGWDGRLSDCDFNFVLGLPAENPSGAHVSSLGLSDVLSRRIRTGEHCFGCTAGQGSSCGGALA
jgi:radical SAM/Cys-rich protein